MQTSHHGSRINKPRIFLGSSGKQAKLLQAITRGLEGVADVEPWTTTFNPGRSTLDRLVELSQEVDFAATRGERPNRRRLPSSRPLRPPGARRRERGRAGRAHRAAPPGVEVRR